jgi:sphingolipid 4-desaturase/C4-monooxygenase
LHIVFVPNSFSTCRQPKMRERVKEKFGELFQRFVPLGFKLEHLDEPWEYSEEPHVIRRQAILKKYPEVKKLMGYDPTTAVIVSVEVIIQIIMCYLISDASLPTILITAYIVSATINHSLGSAIHEIGHNLAFGHKYPLANRALGMLANLPMAIPMSVTYKKYHADHHRYLGHDTIDVDIPTAIETYLFRHPLTKMFWLLIHPIIHGLRPYFKNPIPMLQLEIVNFVVQLSFDAAIFFIFGGRSLGYLVLGTFFGLGFHPLAGHFISEHYLFTKGQATHSYYGPLNPILFNVGYHVEHHDFPYIPFTKLPELKRIAAEFYDPLPYHTSWVKVLWDFIFDGDLGPHARGIGYLPQGVNEEDIMKKTTNGQVNSIKAEKEE